jgi:hypothetical protein
MLIMFGAIMFSLVMLLFLQILFKIGRLVKTKKIKVDYFIQSFFIFFLALLLANYSFGGLISPTGLLPLGVLIGIAEAQAQIGITKNSTKT